MLLTKEVEVKIISSNVEYYKSLGYDIPMKPSTKSYYKLTGKEFVYDLWKTIMVKVEDLPLHSKALVETTCDYCGRPKPLIAYVDYVSQTKNGSEKCCCMDCRFIKQKETLMEKYGVEYLTQSEDIKQKIRETNIDRYGVENVFLNNEIKEKVQQTIFDRYGVDNVSKNKDIQHKREQTTMEHYGVLHPLQNKNCLEKMKQTNLEKYGVENILSLDDIRQKSKQTIKDKYGVEFASQSEEVKQRVKNTNLEKYGVEYPMLLPSFHEKAREVDMEKYGVYHHLQNPSILAKQKATYYNNGTCSTSKQQKYLHNIYGGELNFAFFVYNLDIYFPEEKISIEYDGSGHMMSVSLGNESIENFRRREIIRNTCVKNAGIKQIRIISTKDLLPSDETLLRMLNEAKQYFSKYPNHSWIEFDIDKSIVRNAEHKNGIYYDFGKLRTIKSVFFI